MPVLLLAFVFGAFFYVTRSPAPPAGWGGDLDAALKQAAEQQKPVVIAFHMPNCSPCSVMDRTTLRADVVNDALKSFVPVRVDAARRPDIAGKYGVPGTPTYVVLSPDGAPIAQVAGFQSTEDFVGFLGNARSKITPAKPAPAALPPAAP